LTLIEDADVLAGNRVERGREMVYLAISVDHILRDASGLERTCVSDHASVMFSSM